MALAREKARRWIKPNPSRAWKIDLRPGVQISEIVISPGGTVTPPFNQPFGSATSGIFRFTRGSYALTAFSRLIQNKDLAEILAQPRLVMKNGRSGGFLAGGEFPVPIVQGGAGQNTVSIIFKEYGVRLIFKPTIIDEDHIRLTLEPEVSTIDFANGVKFDGFLIPGLKTRRAKTSIELRDGQSFALAGLLDNSESRSLSKVPVLGDIPVLGELFKSKTFQKNESELMFIVTAQLVKPVNPDDIPQMRGIDGLKKGSPLGVEPKGEGIQGQTGHSISGASNTTTTPVEKPVDTNKVKAGESEKGSTSSGDSGSKTTRLNQALPAVHPSKITHADAVAILIP